MNDVIVPWCPKKILNQLPLGVFMLDSSERIQEWNMWMEEKTGIAAANALGKQLIDLFPGFYHLQFKEALARVFSRAAPKLVSQVLNHCVIPIPLPMANHIGLEMMQQKVQISPMLAENGDFMAMITLIDMTDNILHQEDSYRDPLTNLYNRRFLSVWLDKALLAAQRHAYPVACLMLDIDHFKQINDTHGHFVGDRVLSEFGQILVNFLRDSDLCVRYGGDEFLLILSWSTLATAIARAKALVELVRKSSIGGLPAGDVTCSIGASVFLAEKPCRPEALLKEADEQLYRAKHEGRDCVC